MLTMFKLIPLYYLSRTVRPTRGPPQKRRWSGRSSSWTLISRDLWWTWAVNFLWSGKHILHKDSHCKCRKHRKSRYWRHKTCQCNSCGSLRRNTHSSQWPTSCFIAESYPFSEYSSRCTSRCLEACRRSWVRSFSLLDDPRLITLSHRQLLGQSAFVPLYLSVNTPRQIKSRLNFQGFFYQGGNINTWWTTSVGGLTRLGKYSTDHCWTWTRVFESWANCLAE